MGKYTIYVKTGYVKRDIVRTVRNIISDEQLPSIPKTVIEEPYVAQISVPLGKDTLSVESEGRDAVVKSNINTFPKTKLGKIKRLATVLRYIAKTELKAIYGRGPYLFDYKGMPLEAEAAVENAVFDFYRAIATYNTASQTVKDKTKRLSKKMLIVRPQGIEKIDNIADLTR